MARGSRVECNGRVYTQLSVDIPCKFCSGTFGIIEDDEGNPGLVHSIPYCDRFAGPDDALYLKENRLARMN